MIVAERPGKVGCREGHGDEGATEDDHQLARSRQGGDADGGAGAGEPVGERLNPVAGLEPW